MRDAARLRVVAMTIGQADSVITHRRRHHPPPRGVLFALGVARGDQLVGVVIVGRPVPPAPDDGVTVEVTRTWSDATPHVEVALYRTAWRHARTQSYRRLITHTQAGAIQRGLHAVGLRPVATVPPRAGSHTPRRERTDRGVDGVCRTRWETTATALAAHGPGSTSTGTSCAPHGRRGKEHDLVGPRRWRGSSRPAAHTPQRPTVAPAGYTAASRAVLVCAATVDGLGQGRQHDV